MMKEYCNAIKILRNDLMASHLENRVKEISNRKKLTINESVYHLLIQAIKERKI